MVFYLRAWTHLASFTPSSDTKLHWSACKHILPVSICDDHVGLVVKNCSMKQERKITPRCKSPLSTHAGEYCLHTPCVLASVEGHFTFQLGNNYHWKFGYVNFFHDNFNIHSSGWRVPVKLLDKSAAKPKALPQCNENECSVFNC